ncbi:MAG: hypothetical protein ABI700_29880 [Chloroflexota bacterium]
MIRRRTNLLWGLVVLALAIVLLVRALGVIPDGMFDLVLRAWPALLLLVGLSFLLRERVPFGQVIALLISAIIAVVIVSQAYTTRATQQRADTHQTISQTLGPGLTLLRVRIQTLSTDVDLLGTLTSSVDGEFVGSSDNHIDVSYAEASDSSATLTLHEIRTSGDFPMLETMGRGTLHLELPPNVPLDVEFVGQDGSVVLNMGATALERLNVTSVHGDAVITLPEYHPLLSDTSKSLGTLTVGGGNLALFIPAAVGARLEMDLSGSGIKPEYDPNVYNYLVGDVLEARNIETAPIVMHYQLQVPHGRIRVEVPS